MQTVHWRELQLFIGPKWVFWEEDVNTRLAEPKKSRRRKVEMIYISGKARIHPMTKKRKKRANRKILHYKWQYKMSSNIHKRITLTCNNSPMDLEPQMLRVVAVGRQTRGTATLTAILTSASQSAANASLSNESPPRFRRIEERARVCTAGLFPLWRTVDFLKKSYPFYTVNSCLSRS